MNKKEARLVRKAKAKVQAEAPVVPPAPEPVATTQAATPVLKTTSAPSKYRGLGLVAGFGSLRVMEFQNATLAANKDWQLSDEQLAILWRAEFPLATGRIDASIVRGVRALYNRGRHGKQDGIPAELSVGYRDGSAVTARGKAIAS